MAAVAKCSDDRESRDPNLSYLAMPQIPCIPMALFVLK